MAYKGVHNPPDFGEWDHPRPDGWEGGPEDFETIWNLKGHVALPYGCNDLPTAEAAKISRNHNRLHDAPGFQ